MLQAAHETGTEVLWDLCHWGVPDWLDPFSAEFPRRFESYARAAAEVIAVERHRVGPDGNGVPLPDQRNFILVVGRRRRGALRTVREGARPGVEAAVSRRAAICAIRAVREVLPAARFLQAEPLIHVAPATRRPSTLAAAGSHNAAQFEAWDMIAGRLLPELGGSEDLLDILGVNYYWNNQWVHCQGPGAARAQKNICLCTSCYCVCMRDTSGPWC